VVFRRAWDKSCRGRAARGNDYDFISERALDACSTYGVESISLAAVKEA
jgi:hypothetical protein